MSRVCLVDGCGLPHLAKGFCSKHYERWRKHGDPSVVLPKSHRTPPEGRFWAKVDLDGPIPLSQPELGPCNLWTGSMLNGGYGKFWLPDEPSARVAHACAWLLSGRTIPAGHELDHLCHTVDIATCPGGPACPHRRCVNVDHLELVTKQENTRRGLSFAARNAQKTHCTHGHPLSGANLYVDRQGGRECRTCRHENYLRYKRNH